MSHSRPLHPSRAAWAAVIILSLPLFVVSALANPAARSSRTVVQPDGTSVEIHLWGDEFANGWQSAEGHTLRFDGSTGYWVYAVLDDAGGLTGSTARAGIDAPPVAPGLRPTAEWLKPRYGLMGDGLEPGAARAKAAPPWASGNTNVLVIMVQFPADPADPEGPQPSVPASFSAAQAWSNLFGATSTGPGNMTDYYDEVSFGALNLIGTVVGPYTLAHDKNNYDDGPLGARDMVIEAIQLADADVDFNDFDNDGDGWVDHVAVMYAGNGPDNGLYTGADPDVNNLWPHASNLAAAEAVDGINAQRYYISPELLNNTPRLRTIGVYAHEFGHMLGLPDLYDTDNSSEGIGHWCLMSTGSWCSNNPGFENGEAPSHMSAWCKWFMGWISPTDLSAVSTAVDIPEATTNPYAVRLGANPGGPDDWPGGSGEYFLVENRQQTGFDIGLDGCGLLVWHIDEALTSNANEGHTAASHRLVDLEQADGLNHLDATGNRGDAGDPFPGSTNNFVWDDDSAPHARYYDGTPSDFRMGVLASGCGETMTATFNNQPPVAACQDVQVDADDDCLGHVTAAMVDDGSSDPDGDPITLTLLPPGPYPQGETEVSLTVTDDKGESDTCLATITVVDVTPPMVSCPADIEVECSVAGGVPIDDPQLAGFFAGFMVEDNCDPDPEVVHDAPALFPGPCDASGGVTMVTWTATDAAGNVAQCSATVTVVDTTPPEIEVTVEPQVLWPPNHKLVAVEFTVSVSDVCDDEASWVLLSVTSNEADNGLGDGDMENDIQGADLGTADTTVSLRAERAGMGEGRIYTATFEATDCAGNTAEAVARVYVPQNKNDIGALMTAAGFEDAGSGSISVMVSGASLWPKWTPVQIVDGEARAIQAVSAVVSNTAGLVRPDAFHHSDVDEDGYPDVLVSFARDAVLDLAQRSAEEDGEPALVLEVSMGNFRILNLTEADGTGLDLAAIIAGLQDGVSGDQPVVEGDDGGGDVAIAHPVGLIGAAPNPFNPSTTISFAIPETRHVELAIYDVSGRLVDRLVSQTLSAGEHSVQWLGTDATGSRVSTGVYFYRLTAGSLVDTRRMTLVK